MKTWTTLSLAAILGLGAGALGSRVAQQSTDSGPAANVAAATGARTDAEASIASRWSELDARLEVFEQRLDSITVALERSNASGAGDQLALDNRASTALAAPNAATADSSASFDAANAFAELMSGTLDWQASEDLWALAREADAVEELVALYEEQAELHPNDPDAHTELGQAYIQQLEGLSNGPEVGRIATLADNSFDVALELDENHLGARRSKAIALSFWPPMFGKQIEAANQFEVLIEKQKATAPDDSHAQAYLWLGNMKLQMGDKEAAWQAWRDGLAQFPDNAELLAQLAGSGG